MHLFASAHVHSLLIEMNIFCFCFLLNVFLLDKYYCAVGDDSEFMDGIR